MEKVEVDRVLLWRTLHERAQHAYSSVAEGCSEPQAETPAGGWTAAQVMEHVHTEHTSGEARNTDDLVQLQMLTLDLAVHSWDLARSQGTGTPVDTELCSQLYEAFAPYTDLMAQDEAFAPPVPIDDHAPPLARLVALCGRDPYWTPESLT